MVVDALKKGSFVIGEMVIGLLFTNPFTRSIFVPFFKYIFSLLQEEELILIGIGVLTGERKKRSVSGNFSQCTGGKSNSFWHY
jgi:hypothetical protein